MQQLIDGLVASERKPSSVTVALLGLGLTTTVMRGENRGANLRRDLVVLDMMMSAAQLASAQLNWQGKLLQGVVYAPKYAIAAWGSQGASQAPT